MTVDRLIELIKKLILIYWRETLGFRTKLNSWTSPSLLFRSSQTNLWFELRILCELRQQVNSIQFVPQSYCWNSKSCKFWWHQAWQRYVKSLVLIMLWDGFSFYFRIITHMVGLLLVLATVLTLHLLLYSLLNPNWPVSFPFSTLHLSNQFQYKTFCNAQDKWALMPSTKGLNGFSPSLSGSSKGYVFIVPLTFEATSR